MLMTYSASLVRKLEGPPEPASGSPAGVEVLADMLGEVDMV